MNYKKENPFCLHFHSFICKGCLLAFSLFLPLYVSVGFFLMTLGHYLYCNLSLDKCLSKSNIPLCVCMLVYMLVDFHIDPHKDIHDI